MPLLSRLRRGKKSKGNGMSKPAKADGALDTSSDELIGATGSAAAESDAAAPTSSAAILRAIKSKSALQLQDKSRVDSGGNGNKKKPYPTGFLNKLSKRSGRGGKKSSSSKQTSQRSAQSSSGLSKGQLNVLRDVSLYMQEMGGEPASLGTVHTPPSVPSSPSTQVTAPLSSSPSSLSFVPLISTPAATPTATPAASPARSTKTTRTTPSSTPNRGNKMDRAGTINSAAISIPPSPSPARSTKSKSSIDGNSYYNCKNSDSNNNKAESSPSSTKSSFQAGADVNCTLEEYFQRQDDQNQNASMISAIPKNNTIIRQIPDGGAGMGADGELNAAAKAADDAVAALNAAATTNTSANTTQSAEGDNEEKRSHFPDDQSVEVKLIGRSSSEIQLDKLQRELTLSNPNDYDDRLMDDTTTSVGSDLLTETDTEFGRFRTGDTTVADTSVTGHGSAAKAPSNFSPLGEIGTRDSSIVSHLTTQDVDLTKDSQRSKRQQKQKRKKQKKYVPRARTYDTYGTLLSDDMSYDSYEYEDIEEYDGAADDMFEEVIDAMCCNVTSPTVSHCHTRRQANSPPRGSPRNSEIFVETKGVAAELTRSMEIGKTDEK